MTDTDKPESDPEIAAAVALVEKSVKNLMEHFDTVQVFCSAHRGDSEKTFSTTRCRGSWFTRFGQVKEWVLFEEEKVRACARQSAEEESDE